MHSSNVPSAIIPSNHLRWALQLDVHHALEQSEFRNRLLFVVDLILLI
jgi:hypothetical protein